MKPLIVGQAPSRLSDPAEPLSGRSGRRLAALCGVEMPEFLARFDRVNVMPTWPGSADKGDRFRLLEAVPTARDRVLPLLPGRRAVLLGGAGYAVERALLDAGHQGARNLFWGVSVGAVSFVWHHVRLPAGMATMTCCPHPSGVSRFWNDPANVELARAFWRALIASSRDAQSLKRSPE